MLKLKPKSEREKHKLWISQSPSKWKARFSPKVIQKLGWLAQGYLSHFS